MGGAVAAVQSGGLSLIPEAAEVIKKNPKRAATAAVTGGASELNREAGKRIAQSGLPGSGTVGRGIEDVASLGESAKARQAQGQATVGGLADKLKPAPVPGAPVGAKSGQARSLRAKARTGRDETILTSPLGLTGEANIRKKTLLGQ